jgi:hypothetical protein
MDFIKPVFAIEPFSKVGADHTVSGGENPRIDGAVGLAPRRLAARQRFPGCGLAITGWIC